MFHRLRCEDMGAIVDIQFGRLAKLLEDRKITLDLKPAARAWLAMNPQAVASEEIVCHPTFGYAGRPDLEQPEAGRLVGEYPVAAGAQAGDGEAEREREE